MLMAYAAAVNATNVVDTFLLKALTACLRHSLETASLTPPGRR